MNKLFTLPNCEKCVDVKAFLKEKGIEYEEVNLGKEEGLAELRGFYGKIKDKVERVDGQMPLPLFLSIGEEIKVGSKLEEIKAIVDS